jgi:hypothetical protein
MKYLLLLAIAARHEIFSSLYDETVEGVGEVSRPSEPSAREAARHEIFRRKFRAQLNSNTPSVSHHVGALKLVVPFLLTLT